MQLPQTANLDLGPASIGPFFNALDKALAETLGIERRHATALGPSCLALRCRSHTRVGSPQAVVPRNYYSALSDATNRTLLEVGMVEDRGWLPIREQLAYKYALSVDGNTASTRLAMLLASDQVRGLVPDTTQTSSYKFYRKLDCGAQQAIDFQRS